MTYSLILMKQLKDQGWKVKIRDRERNEVPHVHIFHGPEQWRWNLRDDCLLSGSKLDKQIISAIAADLNNLRAHWDLMYPENPVFTQVEEGEHDDD